MKNNKSIVVLDDELGICALLADILSDFGYDPITCTSPAKALDAISHGVEIGIIDVNMPELTGMEFLKKALKINAMFKAIMITAYGNIENAVECIKIGAFNYISKPFQADEIKLSLQKIEEHEKLVLENKQLKKALSRLQPDELIIGASDKLLKILELAKKVADTDYKVLILGESGTGKELLAQYIHRESKRKSQRFIPVQCSLLPETLLESELFGHKKGSFTGANENKEGIFEAADSGTIFLDEIGDINLSVQGKLLRFLQENEVKKVGEVNSKKVDVRIISATNKNLNQLIKDKQFREDLYYRLKVVTLELPPLRERKEDIPLLAKTFLEQICKEQNKSIELDQLGIKVLLQHTWTGNIRELKHCMECAASICENAIIKKEDIMDALTSMNPPQSSNQLMKESTFKAAKQQTIDQFEINYLTELMTTNGNNLTKAAQIAGMDKKNLWQLLKKHSIHRID